MKLTKCKHNCNWVYKWTFKNSDSIKWELVCQKCYKLRWANKKEVKLIGLK